MWILLYQYLFLYYKLNINIKYNVQNYKNYNNVILTITRVLIHMHVQELIKEEKTFTKLIHIVKEPKIYKK